MTFIVVAAAGPLGLGALPAGLFGTASLAAAEPSPPIDFARDIRPILSDHCFQCHGPDASQRQGELRLDVADGEHSAFARKVIVAGASATSPLLARVTAEDPAERMPPESTKRRLTESQVAKLQAWIDQGARWEAHWSFVPPTRPPIPAPTGHAASRARNAIDLFVARRLAREGLEAAPLASPEQLIRRVTLDLTGLPPTPEQVAEFVRDPSEIAYQRVVDRLLASPRYGERMAVPWLNAARYADTSGYQNDGPREMWRWRDWVIEAYNRNLPFDQFTIEQLAGDLLPDPTLAQRIATGFNRNHRGNAEGGIIPEEYAVEYVVDRVETTATVWLGLTLGCARCHDHKFDPFSQRDFYQLYTYFNNLPEHGRAIKEGNSPPYIQAPTPLQQRERGRLERESARWEEALADRAEELATAQRDWEATLPKPAGLEDWIPGHGLVAALPERSAEKTPPREDQGPSAAAPRFAPEQHGEFGDHAKFGYFDAFSLAIWCHVEDSRATGTLISRMTDTPRGDGYYLRLDSGHVQLNLVKRWLDDSLRVHAERPLAPGWHHLLATYDGSRRAAGIQLYVDGQLQELVVDLDGLNQSFENDAPLRIGAGGGPQYLFPGRLARAAIYDRVVELWERAALACPSSLEELLSRAPDRRSERERIKLAEYYRWRQSPAPLRKLANQARAARQRLQKFEAELPTVMVMQELPEPRPAYVLERGQYNKPGERVDPAPPAALSPLPPGAPNNRLGLAQWIISRDNPLTARVAVNRCWTMFFGQGLVRTSEDFGSQGQPPTHPELLDWLAVELIEGDWDLKALQRLIVTSATYRQSSRGSAALYARDPENRLLARGSRFRLPAEMIRDQALAAAGLLDNRLGGPSVKPYQPADLWKDIATVSQYDQDHGADLYRRSLYTYWKRTVAPPAMMTFDASARETCVVLTTRTNTPLQALTTLNDVTFLEAARALAQRAWQVADSPAGRIRYAFQRVLARAPQPRELDVLLASYHRHQKRYAAAPGAARKLLAVGELPQLPTEQVDALAAHTLIASIILNLDEAVTRE